MNHRELIEAIERRFEGNRERLFIIHGNTGDLFPVTGADGTPQLHTLPDFLYLSLSDARSRRDRIWMHYGVGSGIRWINAAEANAPNRVAKVLGADGELRTGAERPSPAEFFRMVDHACTRRERKAKADGKGQEDGAILPIRLVVTEAHTIFPDAAMHFLRPEDRALLVQLRRFASEPAYDSANTLIVLVTDALASVHRELRDVAVALEVSRPDEVAIGAFLTDALARHAVTVDPASASQLPRLTVGLSSRQVENVVVECRAARQPITAAFLAERRKELVSRDYGELLEFAEPAWTLDDVGGAREAVAEFRELADGIRRGDRDIPAGVIVGGQNGVGKTHVLKAFAGTAGLPVAILKPFKSSGYGDSERAWARIATALTSSGQIVVIVEEADAALGSRTGPNVHEVSKAILAQQLALMGDPRYRGKILWLLDTCRPDKLAPDVKRPGRCERMVPLFPATNTGEARAILTAQHGLLLRNDGYAFSPDFLPALSEGLLGKFVGRTGAQIARAIRRCRKKFAGGAPITAAHLDQLLASGGAFKAEPEAYELQRLIAIAEAIETENDDLIPEFYRKEIETTYHGIGGVKERIETLRRRCDGV